MIIRYNRLRWFGHPKLMDEKWPRKILNFEVNGDYLRSRPKKRFDNIRCDLDKLLLSTSLALDCLNVEMHSNHPDMLQSPILVVGEKNDINWIVSR